MAHNDKQFTITLNERQLKLFAYACRVTNRLIIGQLDFSLQECCESAFEKLHKDDKAYEIGSDEWTVMLFVVTKEMETLRKLCWGMEYGQNHGIDYDPNADILLDMQEIIDCIEPTVEVKKIIKPIYNFKAKSREIR